MARIRTIKPEFWVDEKVVELDPWERLLFIGLWNFADDQGYLDYSVKRIKMQIFPGDTYDVSRGLASLLALSLVEIFESPKGHVLHVANWERHQKISNAAKPKYSGSELRRLDSLPESSRALQSPLESYPAEGKGKEGKGRENPPADLRTNVAVVDAPPVDNSEAGHEESPPIAGASGAAPAPPRTAGRRRDHDQIDRGMLAERIREAAGDRAAQIDIAARLVGIWTDATEAEAERVANAIRLDRQPTNLAALTLTLADAGELPAWVQRVRTEQPYRHAHDGAGLRQVAEAERDVGKPPDLAEVRARLSAASAKHRSDANARPDPMADLRAATDPPPNQESA